METKIIGKKIGKKLNRFRFFNVMPNSEEWNKLHCAQKKEETRIYTASQIPNILGCGYKSRKNYWETLKGLRDDPIVSNPAVDHGVLYEPMAKSQFECKFPKFHVLNCGMLIHHKYDFIGATPDAIILREDGEFSTFEAKCPFSAKHTDSTENLKDFYLQPKYVIQVTLQLAVMKARIGYLHFFFADEEADHRGITFEIPYYDSFFSFIVERVKEFDDFLNSDQIMVDRQKKKITKKDLKSGILTTDQINEKKFQEMFETLKDAIKIIL